MQINIQAPWEVNEVIKQLIEDKIAKLYDLDDRIIRADIFMKTGDNSGVDDKQVDLRLRIPGPELFATANADSFEKAISDVTDKLRRQIIKKKEKY